MGTQPLGLMLCSTIHVLRRGRVVEPFSKELARSVLPQGVYISNHWHSVV